MATTDKTRQQLVESMRKTKAASTATPAARKKRATRKRAPAAAKANTDRMETQYARAGHERRMAVTAPYQSGRRVWPD